MSALFSVPTLTNGMVLPPGLSIATVERGAATPSNSSPAADCVPVLSGNGTLACPVIALAAWPQPLRERFGDDRIAGVGQLVAAASRRPWTKALLAFKIHFGDRLPD